jgi:hypothetical protein
MVADGPGADWGVTMLEWAMATYHWPLAQTVWETPIVAFFALQGAFACRHGNTSYIGLADKASLRARAAMEARIRRDFRITPK